MIAQARSRNCPMRHARILLLAALIASAPAQADDAPAPICTDRPTKSTGTCTADAGRLQLEADLVNVTESRQDGVRTRTSVAINPTLKYGLGPTLDVELNVPAWIDTRVRGATGQAVGFQGTGDLSAKLKWKFLAGAVLEVALMPTIKAPTASRGVGNGAWEGGVLVPVVAKLSDAWSLNLSPEFDAIANSAGPGHHFATAQLINLGRSLAHDVTLSVELWASWDADPAAHHRQRSFDVGAAWLLGRDLQLDGGVNLGLDHETPDWQAYVGVSQRF
jgi:hypothetical protein